MSSLKIIFAIKLAILLSVVAITKAGIRFGDVGAFAANEKEKAKDLAPSPAPSAKPKASSTPVAQMEKPKTKVATPKEEPKEEEKQEAAPEDSENARKSFLGDLLFLPEAPSDGAKKEEFARYQGMMDRKKHQVEDRINLLKKREALLIDLEKSIDKKLKKLEEEIAFFQQTQQKEKQIQKDRLTQLTEFYKKMSPKQAAPVFEKLDKDLVVALWRAFPEKQTQAILALMNPDKAVELSEYFGRLRSAKEYDLLKEINFALRKEFEECRGMPKNEEAEQP